MKRNLSIGLIFLALLVIALAGTALRAFSR
jgi:hypothetical protein